MGLANSWKEIYVGNLYQVFTEFCHEEVDLSKTQPCKYFFYMDRRNPNQLRKQQGVTLFDCNHSAQVIVL